MEWFPPTEARTDFEERSRKTQVSLEKLFHNLDKLLKRDTSDCLSKHLNGLLNNNAEIYQVRPSVERREKIDYVEREEDIERTIECKTINGRYFKHFALKCPDTSVHKPLNSQSNRSRYGKSSTLLPRDVFSSSKTEPSSPPRISPTSPSSNNREETKGQLKLERLPLTLGANGCDVLPSNGWWQTEANHGESSSDSETEADVIKETDCSACLNLEEIKSDVFDQTRSLDVRDRPETGQSSLFSSKDSDYSSDGSKTQTRAGPDPSTLAKIQGMRFEEMRGARETSSFFHLTSGSGNESASSGFIDETFVEPRPPQPTPDPDDQACQTGSENKSMSCFTRSTSFASNSAMFDDDLELDYKELLHHRFNTTSRINYNNLETFKHNYLRPKTHYNNLETVKHNYSHPEKGLIIKEDENFRQGNGKSRKITCVFPKVNVSKDRTKNNRIIPVVSVKRRPNTADVPVKLRLKHRTNAFTKFSKATEETGADERVLPTTLNRSAEVSYSVMTPYMANVVWSVMDDEKVD
ncbi:hypothetical protein OS493_028611 [Desmophyllum pertusum]|uniref:Uncharacterized protein n=1 Tax=Desmophyllum pertusum TaxID=174260 RepID=A0A9X0CP76_9CNID|nr:hypothetical protein OS493_028611 [Desmophyllum pertusum]